MKLPPGDLSRQRAKVRARSAGALLAITVLALLLRGWGLHGTGFTADEVDELHSAHAPLVSIVLDDDEDRFPPLYRTLVALWMRALGTDLASRWFNVVCGVTAVVVVFFAGRELLGRRAAWAPALLLACSPYHIHYCREGRAYALFVLLIAAAFWGALRSIRAGGIAGWCVLTLASAAAVWTHYYAVPIVGVMWLVVGSAALLRRQWKPLAAATGCLLILVAPTALLLQRAMGDYSKGTLVAEFDVEAWGYMLANQALGFSAGPSMVELRSLPAAEGIRLFVPWVAALAVVWSVLGIAALARLGRSWQLLLLLATAVAVVPVLGIAGNVIGVGFVDRYAAWLCVPYALLLGAGASLCRRSWAIQAALFTLLAINGYAVYQARTNPRYALEDFRAVANELNRLADEQEAVLVASPHMAQALAYYLPEQRTYDWFPIFAEKSDEREARIAEFLGNRENGERYWIVSQWLPRDDTRRETRDGALRQLGAELRAELNQAEIYQAVK
ncbi:MAG: hypothetical protein CMJ58_07590 [Planctomycetaceae bacterium]|nr:hypothetical protein [Planctomycetaceae bacterium]